MGLFRINIYLTIKTFFRSLFLRSVSYNEIEKLVNTNSKKKYFILTSQLRVGFLILLKFLKKKYPEKKQIIIQPFNLPEMINIIKNSNLRADFVELDTNTGELKIEALKKMISKKTLAIVVTNIFNSPSILIKLQNLCKEKKILLIEDNAIYFDNFFLWKKKKIFSGSFGDYSLLSFNIMKNISAFYGGGVATSDETFKNYALKEISKFKSFRKHILYKQVIIYFVLKSLLIKPFYKIFIRVLYQAHRKKTSRILKIVYPSLKFKKINFPTFYFTKISELSKKASYLQLSNQINRKKNHTSRKIKNIFYFKLFKKLKIKQVKLLKIEDFRFQNFIDFPIFVQDKYRLNNFLLSKGIETKYIYYHDCAKIFSKQQNKKMSKSSKYFGDNLIGLPNHYKITDNYMREIGNHIKNYYEKS